MTCQMCGKCCKELPIDITYSDIIKWYKHGRYDILRQVSFVNNYPTKGFGGFYIERTLRNPKVDCPFLVDNKCFIYDFRPRVCRDYPDSKTDPKCSEFVRSKNRSRIIKKQKKDFRSTVDKYSNLMQILFKSRSIGPSNPRL